MSKDPTKEQIDQQAQAAAYLIRDLNMMDDDADLIHDTVEGETGLFEAIEVALNEMDECDVQIAGLKALIESYSERKRRAEKRKDTIKGLIEQAFHIAQVTSHKFPRATVSTKRLPQQVIINEEHEIPSEFFVPQPPKLDKKALLQAAKERTVPGATLTNGGVTIQIRRS